MNLILQTGITIGIVFGVPFGAIGAMCIQRTLKNGWFAGLVSGLASSMVDVFYACIGAFGIHVVSDFLIHYQSILRLLGSMFLFLLAISLYRKRNQEIAIQEPQTSSNLKMFLSSLMIAITNPAAIFRFLFAFSMFEIQDSLPFLQGSLLILGIFLGTMSWWLGLVGITLFLKRHVKQAWLSKLNGCFAIVLMIFSITILWSN